MTQLTAARKCRALDGIDPVSAFTILDAEEMYYGGMMAIDYADEVQMASDTQGLKVIGRCPLNVDNTDDGETVGTAGAGAVRGIFQYNNSDTYPIPRSAIGQICYVEDDNTVAGYSTHLVPAGIVHDVDDDGVWVDQRPWALAYAWRNRPEVRVAKTDDYTVTAAIAFDGRTYFACDKDGGMEITLPTAVAGMRVGMQRTSATAAHDLSVQAAAGDRIQGSDGFCAAGKQVDNTVDAVSEIVWWIAQDDTYWVLDKPYPKDVTSWVKNDT